MPPLMLLNPLAPLEGVRLTVVTGHNLLEPLTVVGASGRVVLAWAPWDLAYGTAWSVCGLLASALLFHRLESKFAEYV